ncbi:hydrogenase [Azomonas macrocytogenes]|uniref:Hydrogenase-1 operon protein HyaE n=1 Tax=Azomonas macrocytogenes TaxID=69962 RepID=A0A839T9V1_AZOMA|nr:hydrogenase [Azomonas macrocytogenes]MBB3104815.1 hydrogenase-1 operon protein HyaE [Azomonas macrocytogenes]
MKHPLLARLTGTLDFPCLDEIEFERHVQAQDFSVLFFCGDPKRFPESLDVAVILPELLKVFPQLSPALIAHDFEQRLQMRYGFSVWPTLVFLKAGRYLGSLPKVRDWDEYLAQIPLILALEPQDAATRIPLLAAATPPIPDH